MKTDFTAVYRKIWPHIAIKRSRRLSPLISRGVTALIQVQRVFVDPRFDPDKKFPVNARCARFAGRYILYIQVIAATRAGNTYDRKLLRDIEISKREIFLKVACTGYLSINVQAKIS